MITALHLILLPADDAAPVVRLRADASGRLLGRDVLDPGSPVAPPGPDIRQVLAVPGAQCRVLWLDLPARNPLQAQAAARLLAADHLAAAAESQHIAIAPGEPDTNERLVVCVEHGAMQQWLARATAMGLVPDDVVPAPLLLPLPDDADTLAVTERDGEWWVRGHGVALTAEPELAMHVIGERQRHLIPDPEPALARMALAPPINLLQQGYARTPAHPGGWHAWRRAAALALVLAVSPLVLLAVHILRDTWAASDLEEQAKAEAARALPMLAADGDPLPALRQALEAAHQGDAFIRSTSALLHAVAQLDGAELEAMSFSDDRLVATLAHRDVADIDRIREQLSGAGLALTGTGSRTVNGRLHHTFELGPAP